MVFLLNIADGISIPKLKDKFSAGLVDKVKLTSNNDIYLRTFIAYI